MIPAKDVYVDKHDNITEDPNEYAKQIATAGHFLDDRAARRYGITDVMVSPTEPNARRLVIGGPMKDRKISNKKTESEPDTKSDAPAAEPEADEAKTKQPAKAEAEKGAKKK